MSTLSGHERCWHCDRCGKPICPDCTDDGATCTWADDDGCKP